MQTQMVPLNFFKNGKWIRHPCGVLDGINESLLLEPIDFGFDGIVLGRMNRSFILMDYCGIQPSVDMVWDNGRIKSEHFIVGQGENIIEFHEEIGVSLNFFTAAMFPQDNVFFNP